MGILEALASITRPEFLFLYAIWLVMTRGAVAYLRAHGYDTPATTIGGIALYLAGGALRILAATTDMHHWGVLVAMMVLGPVIFLIRAEHFPARNSGGSCSGSCGGGGCGSGGGGGGAGCGGGGCGGCGG